MPIRTVVTGACGFVGSYLVEELTSMGREVIAVDRPGGLSSEGFPDNARQYVQVDIRDGEAIARVFADYSPQEVYHLAGISSVSSAWEDPALAVAVNVTGTINLLEAVRRHPNRPRTLCVSSASVYGQPEIQPIGEEAELRPLDVYGSSKACADAIARQYGQRYGLDLVVVRPFNHIGPRQRRGFVVPDFASQIALIEADLKPATLQVGNLDAVKDFSDVRDVVRAYALALERARGVSVFNIGSGIGRSIRSLLEELLTHSTVTPRIIERRSARTVENLPMIGDCSRISRVLDWTPQRDLNETLKEVLEWWRRHVRMTKQDGSSSPLFPS